MFSHKEAPALTSRDNSVVAVWQGSPAAETRIGELGHASSPLTVASNAELPAGAVSNDNLFVAYIAKEKRNEVYGSKRSNRSLPGADSNRRV
jgi:hypothetical protein